MKQIAVLLALVSVITAAMAAEPVVIRDTRSGTSAGGAPGSGSLLTRLGKTCTLTEYKRSSNNPNKVSLPIVVHQEFPCDVRGNSIYGNVNEVKVGDIASAITRGLTIQQSTKGTGNVNSVVIE